MKKITTYLRAFRIILPNGCLDCGGQLLIIMPIWTTFWIVYRDLPPQREWWICTVGAVFAILIGQLVNDMWDREIDRQVERTKNRPLACGDMKMREAFYCCLLFFGAGLWLIWKYILPDVSTCITIGIILSLIVIYPTTKRFFFLPQLVLGCIVASPVWIIYMRSLAYLSIPANFSSIWFLFLGLTFWNIGYDTIYALSDREDDRKINIQSAANAFGGKVFLAISICYVISFSCLLMVGLLDNMRIVYYIGLGLFGIGLISQLRGLSLFQCPMDLFLKNRSLGVILFISCLLNYLWWM